MPIKSLRARMTAGFVASITVLLLIVCTGLIGYAHYTAERDADRLLQTSLDKFRRELVRGNGQLNLSELPEEERDLQANNLALLIADAAGRVVHRSAGAALPWPRSGNGWRVAVLPVGTQTVVLGLPWQRTEGALIRDAAALALFSLLVVFAAAIGAWLLVGRTLSPIRLLSEQAQAASADSLHVRLRAPSGDTEVVALVATLNGLLARLGETAASQHRFYAAASHELRTPLQALSGHLEVALGRERTPEEYRDVVAEAHKQTRRLIALAQDLLLLNQLDGAAARPPCEPVDLADISVRVLAQLRPLIQERRLHVTTCFGDTPEVSVTAPPTHALMLIRNLLENAAKYATPGTTVFVGISRGPQGTELILQNACPPLDPNDVDRLFEPFFRPDASRQAATGGNGLGLAICRAIALGNGWNLDLTQNAAGVQVHLGFGPVTSHPAPPNAPASSMPYPSPPGRFGEEMACE